MSQFKQYILLVFLALTFSYSAKAQGLSLTPIEGSTHAYTCNGISEGSNYTFYVVAENGGLTGEYDFIGTNSGIVGFDGLASVQIRWNSGSAFNQYQVWLEVSSVGCSNQIFIGVTPQLNNRSIGFDAVASNACFSQDGNGFELPVSLLANNGGPLSENHYPVNVSFTVNGTEHQQVLEFGTTTLQISETMFSADYSQDTEVLVKITGATDAHNAKIYPGEENSMHARTIFAIPVIEFTQQLKLQEELNEETTAHIMYSPVGFDWQEPGSDYSGSE